MNVQARTILLQLILCVCGCGGKVVEVATDSQGKGEPDAAPIAMPDAASDSVPWSAPSRAADVTSPGGAARCWLRDTCPGHDPGARAPVRIDAQGQSCVAGRQAPSLDGGRGEIA